MIASLNNERKKKKQIDNCKAISINFIKVLIVFECFVTYASPVEAKAANDSRRLRPNSVCGTRDIVTTECLRPLEVDAWKIVEITHKYYEIHSSNQGLGTNSKWIETWYDKNKKMVGKALLKTTSIYLR